MASISANGSRGHHRFTLNVNETGTSTANNTSTVSWSLVLSPIQSGWNWNISGISYSVSVDGVVANGTIQSYDGSSTVTIASGTKTIGHNSDGNKSIGFSFNINDTRGLSYTPGNASSSGSMSLSYIPRKAIVTSATDFNDEGNPTIKYTNPAGYKINARLEFAGQNIRRDNISNTGTYTFELTNEERILLRQACTSNSLTVREVIGTCINSQNETDWSWSDKTMTIVNGNPTFEDFTYQDTNVDVTDVTGNNQVLVKGLSTLRVDVSVANKMVAVKEATPKNYVTTIDNRTVSTEYSDNALEINVGNIEKSGTQRLTVRAYDSRNNSTPVYKDITVYDYAIPTINLEASRLNNFENQTTLKVDGSFSSLNINNIEKNTIQTVQYRYKEVDSQTWNSWASAQFTITNNTFVCDDIIVSLDNTKEFNIEVKVSDNLGNNTIGTTIDVGKSIFFISSNEKKCYINDERVLTEGDKPAVLFESTTPTSSNITITEDFGDYSKIDIVCALEGIEFTNTITNPSGTTAILSGAYVNTAGFFQISSEKITISNNQITKSSREYLNVTTGGTVMRGTAGSTTPIKKIIGYK